MDLKLKHCYLQHKSVLEYKILVFSCFENWKMSIILVFCTEKGLVLGWQSHIVFNCISFVLSTASPLPQVSASVKLQVNSALSIKFVLQSPSIKANKSWLSLFTSPSAILSIWFLATLNLNTPWMPQQIIGCSTGFIILGWPSIILYNRVHRASIF